MTITIHVPGVPKPGGSKRAFVVKGRAVVTDANPMAKDWKALVSLAARQAMGGGLPLHGPLSVVVTFTMPRPKGHYGSGKNAAVLKGTAPAWHTTKPDATKLWRSTEDAMTSIVWFDDSQIAEQRVSKVYGESAGAVIVVSELS